MARARICRNILPATGPVLFGGNQERDFETYLETFPLSDLAFLRWASEGPIIFARSTEKGPAKSRIRSDMDKIMARDETSQRIYFSSEDIPVGTDNGFQGDVRKTYGM